jgi:hypothetical protein
MDEEKKETSAPGGTAPPAGPAPSAQPLPAGATSGDEFDPSGWTVPVICKDCAKGFELPYRHFQAGVVFHCPHCHGSFVPNLPMYRAVRDAFESFYAKYKRERDSSLNRDDERSRQRHAEELAAFRKSLDDLAHAMRPAGKMVRRKGLAAMFT